MKSAGNIQPRAFGFVAFCAAGLFLLTAGCFFGGVAVQRYFPNASLLQVVSAGESLLRLDFDSLRKNVRRWEDESAGALSDLRWTSGNAGFSRPVIVSGGLDHFLETCPERGRLAVEFAEDGTVVHGWPFRPDLLFAGDHGITDHGLDPALDWYPSASS